MRVGFLGVGGIAGNYRRSLRRLGDARVVSVCDVNPERLAAVAAEEGAAAYAGFDEQLAGEPFDALFVCLPPGAHTDQVARAAERDLHLFVAKPVALTAEVARDTLKVIRTRGIIHQSGYMWRSGDAGLEARRLLAGRDVALAVGQVLVGCPGTPWWRVRALSGGQVLEQSTHVLDLMRWLVGEITQVQAIGHTGALSELTDFEDSTVGALNFASGAVGTLASTHTGGLGRYLLTLLGRDWALELDAAGNRLTGRVDGGSIDFAGAEDGYFRQVETFVEACRTGRRELVPTDYADAARSLMVSLAFGESLARGGERVAVAEI